LQLTLLLFSTKIASHERETNSNLSAPAPSKSAASVTSTAQLLSNARDSVSLASLFAARSVAAPNAGLGEVDQARLFVMLQSNNFVRELTKSFSSDDAKV
jgi:hypothetical protein